MLKNYFKIAWRNLKKNKFFSVINISGLAIGLAVGIMLLLWVQDELNFDGFHKNRKDIYRVTTGFKQNNGSDTYWGTTPAPLAVFGKKEIPKIENATRITAKWDASFFEYGKKKFFNLKCGLADPSIFTVFSFPLIKGNPKVPYSDDQSIVLSESTAKKIFGNDDPMGKTVKADDKKDYRVTGIIKDIPANSSIQFDVFFAFDLLKKNYTGHDYWKSLNEDWGNYNYDTYFLLHPNANAVAVGKKLAQVHRKNQDGDFTKNLYYLMQPMSKLHLYAANGNEEGMMIVRIFFIVAIIVLLIACINYTNLVTARATKRAKEISMRKIIGAGKANLFWQFLNESLVILLISLFVATLLIYLVMPLYNDIAGKEIVFNPLSKNVLLIYGITLVATLAMAGIYPAITLSSFKPLEAMKGKFSGLGKNIAFRKVLVVVQFTFSIVLIVSTIIIGKQLKYIREKNLGYEKENILVFNMRAINDHYDAIKAELLKQPFITDVTASGQDIMNSWSSTGDADWDGKTPQQQSFIINQQSVERNFVKALGLKLIAGNGFTGTPADSSNYILNETAIKEMGLKDPLGKRFTFHDRKGTIVGIVKDFHFKSLHAKIEPMILFYNPSWRQRMYVKTTAKDASKTIAAVTQVWKQNNADYPFDYTFMDDTFNTMYKSDIRVGKLFNCFALITIFISCLGLFALVTFTAETKVKEIGVRKVLGASVANIVGMLSKDFLKLVIISTLIAVPVSWWALNKMLQDYAYRTDMSWWIFVFAGAGSVAVALITVSFQAIKAAVANPVKSLRTE